MFFQKLCRDKLDWDATFPDELRREWNALVSDLKEGAPMSIPRSYFHQVVDSLISVTLYGFCDASVCTYAAVIYLVTRTDDGTQVQFVVSKMRVASLQAQTMPCLELLSAYLLSKLMVSVWGVYRRFCPS